MRQSLDVPSWRVANPSEMKDYYELQLSRKKPSINGRHLVVRSRLRPVDIYSYLKARFGEPNGFQNFLRHDSSDNWVHWDFNLKAHRQDVYISGTARDIHITLSESLSDEEWKNLILAIKSDFSRIGREKSEIMSSLEKYSVFQNKFVALADLCAELHEEIVDTSPLSAPVRVKSKKSARQYEKYLKAAGNRARNLYGSCLKLRLLTPIMAEAFLNMIIITFCKDEIRNDQSVYEQFVRACYRCVLSY
jgi:hypothetical protein